MLSKSKQSEKSYSLNWKWLLLPHQEKNYPSSFMIEEKIYLTTSVNNIYVCT